MRNRFMEMDTMLKNGSIKASANGRSSNSISKSTSWSGAMTATNTALVILIENAGVDLGIPGLVDKILSAADTIIPIPAIVRQMLVNVLREKIVSFTDNLMETAELTLNRYNSSAPNTFGSVIVLRNGTASYTELKNTLIRLTRENKIMDVFILTHGNTDFISVSGGINGQKIRDIKTAAGRPLSIRSVYMMNCVGASLNQAWLDAGAKVSSGSVSNNYLPEPTTFFFWNNWKAGQGFETAITSAYRRTINLMNEAVKQALDSVPLLSNFAGSFNFENMGFVRDSAPVIQGQRTVTINSDELTFTQSQSFSNLATTVLPVSFLQSLQFTGAFTNERTNTLASSPQCLELIKSFEGFRANKYNDPVGHCTIGYGTLLHLGNCNNDASEAAYASGISEAQATQLLVTKINDFQRSINQNVTVEMNQNQYDSLVSFSYNIGSGAFRSSTLLRLLNAGDYAAVPVEMRKWTKGRVNGQLVDLPGLVARRNREATLFSTPVTATAKSIVRGMTAVNYAVPGPFDIIKQPSPMTCWAAVMTMMISWKRSQSLSITTAMESLGLTYVQMFASGQGLSSTTAADLYRTVGLSTIISFNPTIEGWENLLRTYGLLYIDIGYAGTGITHAVIVTGISGNGTATGTNITYADPDSGTSVSTTFERFLVNFEAVGAVNWPYVIVHWPAALNTAKSFSQYSNQFYDTGEHAILGQFINAAISGPLANVLPLLPTTTYTINTVPFTYGQLITMGDFYETFADCQRASAKELTNLKTLITRSEVHYYNAILGIGAGAANPGNSEWANASTGIGSRYITLALANNSHFAPPPAGTRSSLSNNKASWELYHTRAIQTARAGTTSDDLNVAYPINAFGDHYLTDSFSAGHLINKEMVMNKFIANVMTGGKVNAAGAKMLERIADGALRVSAINTKLGKFEVVSDHWYEPNWDLSDTGVLYPEVFYRVLKAVMQDTAHNGAQKVANLAVKAVHDYLNHYGGGVPVRNNKGNTWNLTGDGTLNIANINIIQLAVKQSVLNIENAVTNGSTPVANFLKSVWDFVPNLTDATTKGILDNAITTFTTPSSDALVTKAIELVGDELDTLLDELLGTGRIRCIKHHSAKTVAECMRP